MSEKVKMKVEPLLQSVGFVKPFISETALVQAFTKLIWHEKTMIGQDSSAGGAIAVPIEAPGTLALDGGRLYELLSNLPKDEEIELHFTEQSLVIAGKTAKAVLKTTPADRINFTPPKWPARNSLKQAPPEFAQALMMAKFCIDTSSKPGPLGAVCLTKDGYAWATDGSRAVRVPYGSVDLELQDQCLLPGKTVGMVLSEESAPPSHVGMVGTTFWFSWNNRRAWMATQHPPFPNMTSVFQQAKDMTKGCPAIMVDPKVARTAAALAATAGGYGLELKIEGKDITFSCKGEFAETVLKRKAERSRGSATILADSSKLKDALSRFSHLAVCGKGVLFFLDPATNAEHIVMEMVVQNVPPPAEE